MVPFTVEEENLICMYHKSVRRFLVYYTVLFI